MFLCVSDTVAVFVFTPLCPCHIDASRLNFRGACHQLDDDGSNFDDYSV